MPGTVTRPAPMPDGTEGDVRIHVQEFLAGDDRLAALRAGFGARIGLSGAACTLPTALALLEREDAA